LTTETDRVFAELSDMLRAVAESLLPGEEITMETTLIDDLGLDSLSIANLTGRVQSRYGSKASLLPFFADREAGAFQEFRVGELVGYLTGVLAANGPAPADPPAAGAAGGRRGRGRSENAPDTVPASRNGRRPKNDNTGVLAELAPDTVRRLVRLPDGQVEVFTAGDGPTLVLMHPINVGAGVFARQFAALSGDYQVICAHNPGVGATTWDADVSLPGLAGLHRDVLAELGTEPPFHVLGASFGGVVAQQFALSYPEECATLTLAGCSYQVGARRRGPRQLSAAVRMEISGGRKADAAPAGGAGGNGRARGDGFGIVSGVSGDLGEVLLRCESMDTLIGVKYLSLFQQQPSLLARLPEISVPTLVLHGHRDTIVPVKRAHALYGTIHRTQLAEIADAGHFLSLTHPEEVYELLVPFLATGGRSARGGRKLRAAAAERTPASRPGISLTGADVPGPPPDPCTVVIGSGRCGSTMLSRLIAGDPETLSVSESMGHRMRAHLVRDPDAELTGAEYWSFFAVSGREHGAEASLMHRTGWYPAQFSYPGTGRYAGDRSSIPPILLITLPQLTDDPDGLFDQLSELVPGFPPQTALEHHKMLLDLLAGITGKRRWVERTGASSEFAASLLKTFSDTKVVYLTRNIPDTALSMSKHPAFLMTAVRDDFQTAYGVDPYAPRFADAKTLPPEDDMPEEMRRLLPHRITLEALREVGRDPRRFERMAAHANGCAEQALGDVPPRHLLRVRYEDIQRRPEDELTRVGEFIGMTDPAGWAARVADQVRPTRESAAAS
jgi:putative sulfotransferase